MRINTLEISNFLDGWAHSNLYNQPKNYYATHSSIVEDKINQSQSFIPVQFNWGKGLNIDHVETSLIHLDSDIRWFMRSDYFSPIGIFDIHSPIKCNCRSMNSAGSCRYFYPSNELICSSGISWVSALRPARDDELSYRLNYSSIL